MAWWNRPGAGLTPPVTLERVAAWFDARDFAYDLDAEGGRIDSGFGGHTFVVDLVNEGLVTVHGRCWINLPGDEDTATTLAAGSLSVAGGSAQPRPAQSGAGGL